MNDPLFVLLAGPDHVDLFGLDPDGLFARLARSSSWVEARAVLGVLPGYRRPFTLVVVGDAPPVSFIRALAPCLARLVLVPLAWLAGVPLHRPRLRARRAARLALAHLSAPIENLTAFADDTYPF